MAATDSSRLTSAPRRSWRSLRRRVLLHRRLLAAVALGVATYAAVMAYAAPPPATVEVWTAAHDLEPGRVLSADDLVRRPFLPDSAPAQRLTSIDEVVGRTLVAGAGAGMPLSAADVVGDGWLAGRPGTSAVPLRLGDPSVAALLHPGDRVDVLATDPQGGEGELLASDVEVLSLPRTSGGQEWQSGLSGRLVIVAVPRDQARHVASATPTKFLSVLWNR